MMPFIILSKDNECIREQLLTELDLSARIHLYIFINICTIYVLCMFDYKPCSALQFFDALSFLRVLLLLTSFRVPHASAECAK